MHGHTVAGINSTNLADVLKDAGVAVGVLKILTAREVLHGKGSANLFGSAIPYI